MLIYLDAARQITSYNAAISFQEAEKSIIHGIREWYEGDFSFFMGEDKPGMQKSFYLNEDHTIRIEYTKIPESEPTQLDRIEDALQRTQNEIREEGAAIATAAILPMGAAMSLILADAGMDVPAAAGVFAQEWQEWTADGETAAAKSLWLYNGIGYQARTAIQKIEQYAPDKAPNNYAVRPIPDALGVFPTVMNMDVSIGMKLRGEDGKIYECYANPITSLQWQPGQVPASFRLIEG